jgi:hypothetical protein
MGHRRFRRPVDTTVANRTAVFLERKTFYLQMLFLKFFQIQMAGNAPVDPIAVPQYNLSDPVARAVKVA